MTTVVDSGGPQPPPGPFPGILRYIAAPGDWRRLTPDELAAHHAAGKQVAAISEINRGERLALGAAAGTQDGRHDRPLLDELAWPTDRPVFCASDVDVQPASYQACLDYVNAYAAETGRLRGVYGGKGMVGYCMARGVPFGWNSNATSWDHGVVSNAAQLQQHYSQRPTVAGTDENTVLFDDWGGWHPNIDHTPQPEDDDVDEQTQKQIAVWSGNEVIMHLAYGDTQADRDARQAIARSVEFHVGGFAKLQAQQSGVASGDGNNQPTPTLIDVKDEILAAIKAAQS